jgi:hypothetical protein
MGRVRSIAVTRHSITSSAPASMPVQQAVKIEFAVNLKTAKSLGLNLPPTL